MVSSGENVVLVQRYFAECVSEATGSEPECALAVLDELLADDFVMTYNGATEDQGEHGREKHKEFVQGHARTFPKDDWVIEAIVADRSTVACRWRFRGRHAETGNLVDVRAADFFTVRDGRLQAVRRFLDFAEFQSQIEGTRTSG